MEHFPSTCLVTLLQCKLKTHWCTYYRVRDQLLSQQNPVLQIGNVLRKLDSSTNS